MNILPTPQMSTHQANDTLVWIKWHPPVELDHLTELNKMWYGKCSLKSLMCTQKKRGAWAVFLICN